MRRETGGFELASTKRWRKANKKLNKRQKGRFPTILLGTLGASLLGNLLIGKKVKLKKSARGVARSGEGMIRVGQNFQCHIFLKIILNYKDVIKSNLGLMVLSQEIIYLK